MRKLKLILDPIISILNKKADKKDVYTKEEVYTKTESDQSLQSLHKVAKSGQYSDLQNSVGRICVDEDGVARGEIFNYYEDINGIINVASGDNSHAEGYMTKATGNSGSHAEGSHSVASGNASHAEGFVTTASGSRSHAEGQGTISQGDRSHAEGYDSKAIGDDAHAENFITIANGNHSHTEGVCTIASGESQHVQGRYNIEDTENKYAHIVGNGDSDDVRSNAHTLDWSGNAWFAGNIKVGGTGQDDAEAKELATKEYVDSVAGGSGNGSSVELDTTLAISGKAADSKVVGDTIKDVIQVGGTEPASVYTRGWVQLSNGNINIPQIDDSVESADDTWSSQKIAQEIAMIGGNSGVTEERVTEMINEALGVIENGTY